MVEFILWGKFSVNQLDGGGFDDTDADKEAAIINGSTSLINNLNIKQNGKVVYEGNNLFLTTHVKSVLNIQMIMLDL